jgi:GSCFA family
MKFRYELDIKPQEKTITHKSKMMLVGSCFTENIGEKLATNKFTIFENPNGILFNPVSVSEALINVIDNKQYTQQDLFYYNEAWHSWQHHSKFSSSDANEVLQKINETTTAAHNFLKQADYLLITLGSAWIYTLTSEALNANIGTVAANNHKAPASWFDKRLLRIDQTIVVLATLLDRLGAFNKNINVIFTISPVRHLREGVINNNRSKAVLIHSVHDVIERLEKLFYFPAYELVIDDLRDYRYFAEDLVHPNYFATQYVWEKFVGSYTNKETQELMQQLSEINNAFKHKPFNKNSQQHQQFLETHYNKVVALQQQFPYLNLKKEEQYFGGM